MKVPTNRIPWGGSKYLSEDKKILHQWVRGAITAGYAMWSIETIHHIPHNKFTAKDFEENAEWLGWRKGEEWY